jgi:hypothetical protein
VSVTAVLVVLGALVVLLIRTRWLRFSGALVCIVFGLVLGMSPMGPASVQVVGSVGGWAYDSLRAL